jgi:hypothetical protein
MKLVGWRVAAASLVVCVAASACAAGTQIPTDNGSTQAVVPSAPARVLAPAREIDLSGIAAGNQVFDAVMSDGVAFASVGASIVRIDVATGRATTLVTTPTIPRWLQMADGDLWAQFPAENMLRRIRTSDGKITAEVQLDSAPSDVFAATPGSIWTVIADGGVLVRVDTTTAAIAGRVTLGASGYLMHPQGLMPVGDTVFVVAEARHQVMQISADGSVKRSWDLPWQPCVAVPGPDGTFGWIFSCSDHRIARLDLGSGAISTVFEPDDLVGDILPVGDGAWFTASEADRDATNLIHVSSTGQVQDRIDLAGPMRLGALSSTDGIWVITSTGLALYSWGSLR